ncbi:MAG: 30S ribosome-binding factor RbfA [Caldilineaceae bacterium]|nr:30S ribosome-binding factor RbfA [Caldilineaceae bacterium]
MATIRQQRVTGLLFEELSIMVANELDDPKLGLITVVGVQVSRDLRNVKVFVNHQQEEVSRQEVLKGLERATPYLRSQLAERCSLRMVPELLFYYDDTPEKAARVDELLRQIAGEREQGSDQVSSDDKSTETSDASV